MPLTRSQNRQVRRTLWQQFLNDLTYLLPAFGAALGFCLLLVNSPFWGAPLMTLGVLMLMLRINAAFSVRRERQFIEHFKHWMVTYFEEHLGREASSRVTTFRASRGHQPRRG
ncbi:MAG: hypothetical protein EBU88_08330 [Acidobacteria bacterium]|nr:hypothetical protein [Acidobacteriota bacterium]